MEPMCPPVKTEQYLHRYADGWVRPPVGVLDSDSTMVWVFGSSNYLGRSDVFEELERIFPKSTVLGCSGGGVIWNDEVLENALLACVCKFERAKVWHCAWIREGQISDERIGKLLGQALLTRGSPQSVMMMADGLKSKGEPLLRGLQLAGLEQIPIWGGMAGDGSQFRQTWVYCSHQLASQGVIVVGLAGSELRVRCGKGGGWKVLGPRRTVTSSRGNQVFAMDNRSILEIYTDYLGDLSAELPAIGARYPLMVKCKGNSKSETLRSVLSVDRRTQSMCFAGEVPEGSSVQMMRGDLQSLLSGAREVAVDVSHGADSVTEGVVIACNCIGRRMVLGQQADLELDAVRAVVPEAVPIIGFYSMGEIAPLQWNEPSAFLNETLTLTYIAEANGSPD